jgi:hypothetical protein
MATATSHSPAAAVAIPAEADCGPTFCGTCKRRSDKGVSETHLLCGGSEAICVCHESIEPTQSENDALLAAVTTEPGEGAERRRSTGSHDRQPGQTSTVAPVEPSSNGGSAAPDAHGSDGDGGVVDDSADSSLAKSVAGKNLVPGKKLETALSEDEMAQPSTGVVGGTSPPARPSVSPNVMGGSGDNGSPSEGKMPKLM